MHLEKKNCGAAELSLKLEQEETKEEEEEGGTALQGRKLRIVRVSLL